MRIEPCAIFPVESGAPIIGLGILMAAFAIVTYLIAGYEPMPLPVAAVFLGFGIFLVWLGLKR
ncbi:MAG: hypothetical protein QHG99_05825 [Methanomicrobiales archaeon]|nr:hypothetical protein [Methanomicrobiales archaeon]